MLMRTYSLPSRSLNTGPPYIVQEDTIRFNEFFNTEVNESTVPELSRCKNLIFGYYFDKPVRRGCI